MDSELDWTNLLKDHPIFSLPKSFHSLAQSTDSLELSTNTLPDFISVDPSHDGPTPSGRRQTMVIKDSDLIVAAGKELRITSLGETRLGRSTKKTYKTLHTPNIQFEIHQIVLNPSGKLLAVAGAFQVVVVVLPRPGFMRLVPETIDCKSVQIGQFYHASADSAPVAKVDWHPWGDAGSTMLVMTVDGKLREYDVSMDTEEPQQVLSFVPERRSTSFNAEDASEREVSSFTLGKGRADWGPLTVYACMKSGDIYSICPYMPQNSSIPSSYIHSLECFISAKQEFIAQGTSSTNLSTLYDYQHKYVTALIKQLPPGTVFPAASRSVLIHPPTTIKSRPSRQGPFLLQPSPRLLEGSDGGDATDITYLSFSTSDDFTDEDGGETEHMGVIMLAYQDGKVDVFLDVEKVEARWDLKQNLNGDLPMLAVYETIDLGIVSSLSQNQTSLLNLLNGNHPVFTLDPIHDDTLYVYHAFGVHALQIGPILQSLSSALRSNDSGADDALISALQKCDNTIVLPILTTFSVERKCSNPVVSVAIPSDVYLTYSIFILTSAMRITSLPLNLQSDSIPPTKLKAITFEKSETNATENEIWLTQIEGPPTYVSLLKNEPYKPSSVLTRQSGLPSYPAHSIPGQGTKEFLLTPDTLRYIGTTVAQISSQIQEILLSHRAAESRAVLQQQELIRMSMTCKKMESIVENLRGERRVSVEARFDRVQTEQSKLIARLDRTLQRMMEKASPELSEHETKWFEELKRMRDEIVGLGKYDDESLVARVRTLERELRRLTPNLKTLLEKEKSRRDVLLRNTTDLGVSQAFELGERSNQEKMKISTIEQEITKLATKLDLTLTARSSSGQ